MINLETAKTTAENMTFGVEIEFVFNGSGRHVAEILQNAGINAQYAGYTHNTTPHWKVVSDVSVNRGWEVVSPILTSDQMDEVITVCNALSSAGATVDISCGLHVHVGARNFFTEKQIRNILKRAIKFEGAMDSLVPPSRRASRWANGFSNKTITDINHKIKAVDSASDLRHATRAVCTCSRYHKINLESYWRHGTVEFRQHSGSLDGIKVTRWISFCISFAIRGAYGPEIKSVRQMEDPKKLRSKMLVDQFGKGSATENKPAIRFFQKRAKALAA